MFYNPYTRVKWLSHHHITVLDYSESDYIFPLPVYRVFSYDFMLLAAFHFSLKNSFQHFLQGKSSGGELPQLLFAGKAFISPS